MFQGYKTDVFVMNASGVALNVQREIMARLEMRISLQQVNSVDLCDVIIVFVPVVSRVGTDIEAALKNVPTIRPVVLIVLHHTFEENYVAPDSNLNVNRDGVFTANLCWYEDCGLLRCLANDKALKSITERLSPNSSLTPVNPQPQKRIWIYILAGLLVLAGLAGLAVFIYCLVKAFFYTTTA